MKQLAETLAQRAILYRLLGGIYTYPLTLEKVEPIIELKRQDKPWKDSLISLQNYLKGINNWEVFLEETNIEYTRLFEGPGQHPAPPFASFYLGDGTVMGAPAVAVRQEYIKWNLAPILIGKIPDDHIALELTFMSYLANEAYLALSKNNNSLLYVLLKTQEEFLNKHLISWALQFCSNIISASTMNFFKNLTSLTKIYIETDFEWILTKKYLKLTTEEITKPL